MQRALVCARCGTANGRGRKLCQKCRQPLKRSASRRAPGQAALNAVAKTAARLCDASDALIWQVEGDQLRLVAMRGPVRMTRAVGEAFPLNRNIDRQMIHVRDLTKEHEAAFPFGKALQKHFGFRSLYPVPQNLPRRRVTQSRGRKRVVRGLPIRPWPES